MASKEAKRLSEEEIAHLSRIIAVGNMETIALRYLGLKEETIANLHHENQGKTEAFNRSVLRHWAYKNADYQRQVSLFYFLILQILVWIKRN